MEFTPFFFGMLVIFISGKLNGPNKKKDDTNLYCLLIILFLAGLAGFRSVGTGSDDKAYVQIFSDIPALTTCKDLLCGYSYSEFNIEFGFFILVSFLSLFSTNQVFLFFVIAFIALYFNIQSIRFFSPYIGASALIYYSHLFFSKEMNAIRLGLASALAFYATVYLFKNKKLIFFLFLSLAVSIHVSLILLLIPSLLSMIAPRKTYIFIIGMSVIAIIYFFDVSHLLAAIVNFGPFESKIDQYTNASEYNHALSLLDPVNVRNLFFVGVSLLGWDKIFAKNEKNKFVFYFFFSSTFFRILFGDFAIIAGRGYGAISMFEVILLPLIIIASFGNRVGYYMTSILALAMLISNLYVNTGWGGGGTYFNGLL